MSKKKLYGMYSAKQAQSTETAIYLTPSGEEVAVTQVGSDPEFSDSRWDDKILKGEVAQLLRKKDPDPF